MTVAYKTVGYVPVTDELLLDGLPTLNFLRPPGDADLARLHLKFQLPQVTYASAAWFVPRAFMWNPASMAEGVEAESWWGSWLPEHECDCDRCDR